MIDPSRRFTGTADDYHRYRPTYPAALLDWVLATAGVEAGSRVCDLGCGTGISTRLMAERGLEVVGVDPNESMLEVARREGGPARYLRGEAAATGLPDGWAHLATAAQSFHWFELGPTLRELARILRPGARTAAFWNVRARSPFLDDYEALLVRRSPDYSEIPRPVDTLRRIRESSVVADLVDAEFVGGQTLDLAGVRGRALSTSYVRHGVEDLGGFLDELSRLFERHQEGGRVHLPYRCPALSWTVRPSGSGHSPV
ncbi:MAG: methyltransferase domain-containing protein [Planctomycetes bacterium]|nr:methyltransferase domain-containing protein [Planctomycetota bacterium]